MLPPIDIFCSLLDYWTTTAGRHCHCDLVPSVLFMERSETSNKRESILMSVIIGKEETRCELSVEGVEHRTFT